MGEAVRKLKNLAHLVEALLANVWYGFPSRKLCVIGITGTDGKTTTANLLYHILERAGQRVAMITTVGAAIAGKNYDIGFHVTTPSPFALQQYIRKVVDSGNEYLVLEVTSHGLDQNRAFGVRFDLGLLTNITHEHLDFHRTYERYVKAKAKLFRAAKTCALNLDDTPSYLRLLPILKDKKIIRYSLANPEAEFTPEKFLFSTKLLGDFNRQNCLAAIAAARSLGIDDGLIRQAVADFTPPVGRQEVVYDGDFKVIIDFAHTPNAFAAILPVLKASTSGRLIHVFGAAGQRDATKRPAMGRESARSADVIILTAEDSRTEPIADINAQIRTGITGFTIVEHAGESTSLHGTGILVEIHNRRQAIISAIRSAFPGDTVVLTGKSHEKSMNYGQGEESWSEHEAVREALALRAKMH